MQSDDGTETIRNSAEQYIEIEVVARRRGDWQIRVTCYHHHDQWINWKIGAHKLCILVQCRRGFKKSIVQSFGSFDAISPNPIRFSITRFSQIIPLNLIPWFEFLIFFCRTKRLNCIHIVHQCCAWMQTFTVGWRVTRNVNKLLKQQWIKPAVKRHQWMEIGMKIATRLKNQHSNHRPLHWRKRQHRAALALLSMPMIVHSMKICTSNWKMRSATCTRCGMKLMKGKFCHTNSVLLSPSCVTFRKWHLFDVFVNWFRFRYK